MHDQHPETLAYVRRGDVIGDRYVLGDILGVGGMGVVYAAVQRSLDRPVALKLPRRELVADPGVRRRFRTESLASARLDHRNIVRVLDFGEDAGAQFLVMELIAGCPLGELLAANGTVSVAIAVGLVRQIVAGLADAHARGVAHGDVKCANILVETLRDGTALPRLIDFGLARVMSHDQDREHREVSGTPEYLAPELIRGGPPTFRSDVYSVGVVLYELISGATPFSGGTSAQVLHHHLHAPLVPLSLRCQGVPPALDQLLARALAKRPSERFTDAAALGAALDAIALEARPYRVPSGPVVVSTAATTAPLCHEERSASRHRDSCVRQCRAALDAALACDDNLELLVISYLELAHALIDDRALADAIEALESGVVRLSLEPTGAPSLWRLQLTLATFYDRAGAQGRACRTAREAHASAVGAGSTVGMERARQLLDRLLRDRTPVA